MNKISFNTYIFNTHCFQTTSLRLWIKYICCLVILYCCHHALHLFSYNLVFQSDRAVHASVSPSVCLFIFPSVRRIICPSFHLFICSSVYISVFSVLFLETVLCCFKNFCLSHRFEAEQHFQPCLYCVILSEYASHPLVP